METPKKPAAQNADAIESLPPKPLAPKDADQIKGGAMLAGGDDDLEDLEVERLRRR